MARKKNTARLDREIAEALETHSGSSTSHSAHGDRVLADLASWGIDRALIDEVREAFRAGNHSRAMTLAHDLGWNRASKRGRAFR
jgi:hypothetical protein